MAKSENKTSQRETVLAIIAATLVGTSLLDLLVTLLIRLFAIQPWPILSQYPLLGLPAGFLVILVLLLTSTKRGKRDSSRNDQ